jgi:hypothetical protein
VDDEQIEKEIRVFTEQGGVNERITDGPELVFFPSDKLVGRGGR